MLPASPGMVVIFCLISNAILRKAVSTKVPVCAHSGQLAQGGATGHRGAAGTYLGRCLKERDVQVVGKLLALHLGHLPQLLAHLGEVELVAHLPPITGASEGARQSDECQGRRAEGDGRDRS